ncbi:MAG: outer membrane lipid asymmetry maintenance protein MlaD [Sandarakinorhabdus sp.]|jgi:phospholipid/cholesterol/gamma-HCH transport system substrate-binding protein|nr:outer membrane lipid asymmetry maintenance protein MlaD [Sandarakinorhabdus sp.]
MGDTVRDNLVEAAIGFLVVVAAVAFVAFAWARTGAGEGQGGTSLVARFPNIAGVTLGTDVKVAGVKVGRVTALSLDPGSYQAVLTLSVDPGLKLPVDSSAAVTSEGLLGGNYIALTPGAEAAMLKAGDEIIETSGAPDLMGLIGSVVNRSGGEAPPASDAPSN